MSALKKGLTDADRAEIERLTPTLKTPSKIARRIGAHQGTVNWFMIRRGLVARQIRYLSTKPIRRANGRVVNRYTREQDERICELRRQGKMPSEIAAAITAEFEVKRTGHSIFVRLQMLAAYEGGPEA